MPAERAMVALQQRTSANLLPMSRSQIRKLAGRTVSERVIKFGIPISEFGRNTTATSTAFLTVTVTGVWDQAEPPSPGNYDPSVAQVLADVEIDAWNKAAPGSTLRQDLAARQQFFTRQSMRMRTGGSSITWWGSTAQIATSET